MVTTFPFLFDQLISQMMIDIFGSPAVAGISILMFFYIVGLAMRLTFEVQMVMMFFVSMLVVGIFVPWVYPIVALVVGILFAVFVIYWFLRQ